MGNSKLRGVGGWLLFLCVVLTIISPLAAFTSTLKEISDIESTNKALSIEAKWSDFKVALWMTVAIQQSIGFSAGYILGISLPSSIRYAIFAIWFSGPVMTLISVGTLGRIADRAFDYDYSVALTTQLPGHIAFAVVWTIYLKVSKRVKNTYFNVFPEAP